MSAIKILGAVVIVSGLANAALVHKHLQQRDAIAVTTHDLDNTRALAGACSDGVEDLRTLADQQIQRANQLQSQAQAQAQPHKGRAAVELAKLAPVPGDVCASASARAQAWLKERGQ